MLGSLVVVILLVLTLLAQIQLVGISQRAVALEEQITALEAETRTMVFYESPYRLVKTLEQFMEHFGPDRRCSVAREISKLHEEHRRGTLREVALWFTEHEPKGEIVIIVAGAEPVKPVKQKRYGRGEETEPDPEA